MTSVTHTGLAHPLKATGSIWVLQHRQAKIANFQHPLSCPVDVVWLHILRQVSAEYSGLNVRALLEWGLPLLFAQPCRTLKAVTLRPVSQAHMLQHVMEVQRSQPLPCL